MAEHTTRLVTPKGSADIPGTVCHNNLLIRGPILSEEEARALDDACKARNRQLHATGRRRHHVNAPSFYLPGPLLPILLPPGTSSAHHPLGIGHRYT